MNHQQDWIEITVENAYPVQHFVIPKHYEEDVKNVLIPYGLIQDRIRKLAEMIARDSETSLVACCVLKGAHTFFSHLTEHLKKSKNKKSQSIPISFEFIKVKSYENDSSTGKVSISLTEQELQSFKGKEIVLIEDIVDSGLTMSALIEFLKPYQPSSIKVVSLLLKRTHRSNGYIPNYVGFSIPDEFVIGYGLDYNEQYRDLDHICVINDVGKAKYAV